MIPATHLLTPPDALDAFGSGMSSSELIRKLQRANPKVCVPSPHAYVNDGPAASGTGLWLGPPKEPGSKFICGMDCGQIPEWTQVDPDGRIIIRGWRAILQRCIDADVASRETLEAIFQTSLLVGRKSRFCPRCAKRKQWNPVHAASGLCDDHDQAAKMARLRAQP